MKNQKHKLKPCPFGTLAFRRLWAYSKGKRRTMKKQLPAATATRNDFSLKRCSANQHLKSDEDTAFNQTQTEKKMEDQLNTRPVSAAAHKELSLKRCSANQPHKSDDDTEFNQTEKKMKGQLNTLPVSTATRVKSCRNRCYQHYKSGKDAELRRVRKAVADKLKAATRVESCLKRRQANEHDQSGKDAAFSQAGKDMIDKLKTALRCLDESIRFSQDRKGSAWRNSLRLKNGICHSRATLIENVEENGGEMRLALSPIAVELYKDGIPLESVVRKVGIQNAFDRRINSKSVWVTVTVENGKLSVSIA